MIPLVVVFALLNTAARALGSSHPPSPILNGFIDGCAAHPQPCWYGILPGKTTIAEASAIIEGLGYSLEQTMPSGGRGFYAADGTPERIFMYSYDAVNVNALLLNYARAKLQVGDALNFFGIPRSVFFDPITGHGLAYPAVHLDLRLEWPSLRQQVWTIWLSDGDMTLSGGEGSAVETDWRGFAPFWRYCQLDPAYTLCTGRQPQA